MLLNNRINNKIICKWIIYLDLCLLKMWIIIVIICELKFEYKGNLCIKLKICDII